MKSKTVSIFFCAVMVASVFAPMAQNVGQQGVSASGSGGLADSPWPMFRHDLKHTRLSPYDTSGNQDNLKWSFTTDGFIYSSPAIGSDGTIYFGSYDGNLYAIGDSPPIITVEKTANVTTAKPGDSVTYTIYFNNTHTFNPTHELNHQQLTFENSDQRYPYFNPDGSKIVYSSYEDGGSYQDIWIMDFDGSNHQQLTFENADQVLPSFSPDGSRIVYHSYEDLNGGEDIWIMDADGSNHQQLTDESHQRFPRFSPNSSKIVYMSQEDGGVDYDVWIMDIDGSNRQQLTFENVEQFYPSFSPDGDRIVYSSNEDGGSGLDVWIMNTDGSNRYQLTFENNGQYYPSFSPDGSKIIYTSREDGGGYQDIWIMNADGTDHKQVTSEEADQMWPTYSQDGGEIVYHSKEDNGSHYDLWILKSISEPISKTVYINDILPLGVTFITSSAEANRTGDYNWTFFDVGPGKHSFTITVQIDGSVPNGTILTNFVHLNYTDSSGIPGPSSWDSVDVMVLAPENQPPVADAGPNQTVNEGDIAQFNGSASFDPDGTIETYEWDFDANVDSDGDGNTTNDIDATGPTPSHVYGDDGVYTVTLTVTDYDGLSGVDTMFVTVQNVAPTGRELLVNGDFSDGTQGWNQALHGYVSPGSIPPLPPSRYSSSTDNGYLESRVFDGYNYFYQDVEVNTMDLDFRAKFRAVDFSASGGLVAVTVHMLSDQPPGFSGNPPSSSNLSIITSLIVGRITWYFRPDHIYQSSNTSYWELLGTGPSDWYLLDVNLHDVIIAHLPEINESQVKWLRIWISTYGESGGFTIGNYDDFSLRESILIGPDLAYEGHALMFTAQVIDPGSDDLIFTWDWGDGSPPTINTHYNDAVGPDPYPSPWGNYPFNITDTVSHIYGDNGVYWVTLTVEDDDCGTTTCNTIIIVNNVAPIVDALPNATIDEGGTVTFSGHATDPGSDDLTFTWSWEYAPWGDKTSIYYNDGVGPDPYPSPTINPRNITENATCQFGDDGVFTVSLTVTDDDGASTIVTTNVTVNNVAPKVIIESATMYVEIGLRVAGRKYNDVGMILYEDGNPVGNVSIERMPGSPNDQMAWIPVTLDMTKTYSATVTYTPEDPPNIGANPVWIYIKSKNGSINKIHHTFNVQQSKKRNSEHRNHVEPWEVDLNGYLIGHSFEITSHITDPGSDDETLTFTYGSQAKTVTYLNNPPNPDPYPSPEVNPRDILDTTIMLYEGTGTLTLTVEDDDGGIGIANIDIV